MGASYRLIRPDELDAGLVAAWRGIQSTEPGFASPYFSPEFSLCVGRIRRDARIAVIENEQKSVGFFPYQRGFLGVGRPIGGALSDFHGVLTTASGEWNLLELVRASRLSVWAYDHLVGNTPRPEFHVTARAQSPQIDLSSGYDLYAKGRRDAGSDYIRKTEGLARKLAREFGDIEFLLEDRSSTSLNQILAWKSEQYRQSGITDVLAVPWAGALLRQVAESSGETFSGMCSVLRVGGRVVAGHIGMRSSEVLHYWFPAYDPEFAKFSVGIILLLRMAQSVSQQGVRTIDLGKGISPYKERLMSGYVEVCEGYAEVPSVLGNLRSLRRQVEDLEGRGSAGRLFELPLRVVRRIERSTRFR